MAADKWIQKAINPKHKGDLRKELGIPEGKKIPKKMLEKAAKAPGKEGKRARLAETLESFPKTRKKIMKQRMAPVYPNMDTREMAMAERKARRPELMAHDKMQDVDKFPNAEKWGADNERQQMAALRREREQYRQIAYGQAVREDCY